MAAVSRFISGSVASWLRLGVGIFIQISVVPLYLRHWGVTTYGVWLGVIAMTALFDIVNSGHQTYIGNEFMRVAPMNPSALPGMLSSALCVSGIIGAAQLGLAVTVVSLDWHKTLIGVDSSSMSDEAGAAIIAIVSSSFLFGSVGGVAVRLFSALGYFARMEWWGVGASLVGPFVPLTAVILGYSLKIAGFGVAAWVFVYAVVLFADMLRLLRRSEITWVKPDRHRMLRSFTRSLAVTVRMILDMARQQGTSLLLAPLVGAAQMAVFATMRTGANVTKQGLATITNPLMPELMRFLAQRDQARSEAAFAMVWLVVCAVMGPAVLVLQCVAPELFTWWTLGKMAFDGWLLGTLSLGVLVFGAAQPAFAVVQGNNLLRTQLIVSVLSGVIAVAGLVLLVPRMGIRGAAIALLAAEIAALLVCRRFAGIWLEQQGMHWPKRGYRRVLTSVLLAGVGMVAITAWPATAWLWVIVCGLGMGCCLISYISCLPLLVRQRFAHRLSNLPIVGALLQIK